MSSPKRRAGVCMTCGKASARTTYKYCSNVCQMAYQRQELIEKWKSGKETGLSSMGMVNLHVKRYLREKYQNRCCVCGWSEINPKTGKVPLVADHIDGNWRNNVESNLRLICPNCDSLSPTHAALNKGNGRDNRTVSKRALDAKVFLE